MEIKNMVWSADRGEDVFLELEGFYFCYTNEAWLQNVNTLQGYHDDALLSDDQQVLKVNIKLITKLYGL